jgi:hypothetical protein
MPWRWPKRSRLEQDGGLVRQPGNPVLRTFATSQSPFNALRRSAIEGRR